MTLKLTKTELKGLGQLVNGECYIGNKTSGTYLHNSTASSLCAKGLARPIFTAKAAERIFITERGIAEWERRNAR